MNLSKVPRWRKTTSTSAVRYSRSAAHDLLRRVELGEGREPPDVREKDRQHAAFAAEGELGRVPAELLDDRGWHVLAERLLDPPALALLGQHLVSHAPDVPHGEGHQRGEQQDPGAVAEAQVDEPGGPGREAQRDDGAPDGADAGEQQRPDERQQQDGDRLDDLHAGELPEPAPLQEVGEPGGVALDARHDGVEGRGPDVHQAVGREAHEDDVVLDGRRRRPGEDVHGRDGPERARRAVVGQVQDAAGVRRDDGLPDLDPPIGREADAGPREAQRQARGLESQAGIETVAEPDDQLDPAQRAVRVGMDVDVAVPGRRGDEPSQRELDARRAARFDRLLRLGRGEADHAAPVEEALGLLVERGRFVRREHEEVRKDDPARRGQRLGERLVGVGVRRAPPREACRSWPRSPEPGPSPSSR